MAFQPFNYAALPVQGKPWLRDFVENLASGYKAGQVPAELQRQKQKEQLANALSQLKVEEEPQRFQSELTGNNLANALAQLKLQQEPQRFQSELSGNSLGNQLKQLQIKAAEMEVDPKKQLAYLIELSRGYEGGSGGNNNSQVQKTVEALIRKKMGLPAQTPDEKFDQAVKLERAKQDIKTNGSGLTTAATTALQTQNNIIDTTIPVLKDILESDIPSLYSVAQISPNLRASYDAQVASAIDRYAKALNFMGVKDALHKAEQVLRIGTGETAKHYKTRISKAIQELGDVKNTNLKNLKPNMKSSESPSGRIFNLESGEYE